MVVHLYLLTELANGPGPLDKKMNKFISRLGPQAWNLSSQNSGN
jgi:hypothetical protein